MAIFFKRQNLKKIIIAIFSLAVFFILGMEAEKIYESIVQAKLQASASNPDITVRQSDIAPTIYRFIDPLLACDVSSKKQATEFIPLKIAIQSVIDGKVNAGKAGIVSVYFDTRDGNWLDINPGEKFSPASLLKVPTAIAYFEEAESNPALLQQKLFYDGSSDLNSLEYFKSAETIKPNQSYTVEDLLSRMLGYSDNNASDLLIRNMNIPILNEVYGDLGVVLPKNNGTEISDYITVKQYANFFRILYNASYLNREMSEKALSFLALANFSQGLKAGIPAGVVIAQKFGERDFTDDTGKSVQKELHDCGIIYYPGHPYLLCVMTKGTDFDGLAGTISDISSTVYKYIDQHKDN
jgi:beta-lactamase class A